MGGCSRRRGMHAAQAAAAQAGQRRQGGGGGGTGQRGCTGRAGKAGRGGTEGRRRTAHGAERGGGRPRLGAAAGQARRLTSREGVHLWLPGMQGVRWRPLEQGCSTACVPLLQPLRRVGCGAQGRDRTPSSRAGGRRTGGAALGTHATNPPAGGAVRAAGGRCGHAQALLRLGGVQKPRRERCCGHRGGVGAVRAVCTTADTAGQMDEATGSCRGCKRTKDWRGRAQRQPEALDRR